MPSLLDIMSIRWVWRPCAGLSAGEPGIADASWTIRTVLQGLRPSRRRVRDLGGETENTQLEPRNRVRRVADTCPPTRLSEPTGSDGSSDRCRTDEQVDSDDQRPGAEHHVANLAARVLDRGGAD